MLIVATAAPSSAAITDNLVSYYKCDGTGSFVDTAGSNTLAESSGTMDSVTGKINNGRDFEAGDTELAVIADNASLSITSSMTITAWVNPESFASNPNVIVAKFNTGSQRSYRLALAVTTGQATFTVSNDGTATVAATASTFGNLSTGTWYFICARFDDAGDLIKVSVNNVQNTAAHTTGIFDSTANFQLGDQTPAFSPFDGVIDEVGIWSRALSDGEVTSLYNSGSGLAHPFITATQAPRSINQYRLRAALPPAKRNLLSPFFAIAP
jgi:Concanavalin A-like lectin/glucanases superfamily